MRLFLAINFPEGVKNALSSGMTALARRGVRANWSRRENLHLTLEFLGEVRDTAPVVEAMERVKAHKFSICFTDTGRLPPGWRRYFLAGRGPDGTPLMRFRLSCTRRCCGRGCGWSAGPTGPI